MTTRPTDKILMTLTRSQWSAIISTLASAAGGKELAETIRTGVDGRR